MIKAEEKNVAYEHSQIIEQVESYLQIARSDSANWQGENMSQ